MAASVNHMMKLRIYAIYVFLISLYVIFVSAIPATILEVQKNEKDAICALSTCSSHELVNSSIVLEKCVHHNYTVNGRCCTDLVNDTGIEIIGADLSECLLTNTSLLEPHKHLKWIVLEDNPRLNHTDFEGLSEIEYLSLPPSFSCPGGDEVWESVTYLDDVTICEEELNACLVLDVNCPKNVSSCYPDGPGQSLCLCEAGRYGYKCLRSAYFPYVLFVPTICGVTLILSVFLGATQRIRVKKKKER